MKREGRFRRVLKAVNRYIVFFLLVAFVITCCMTLFLNILMYTMDIEFTQENITAAARLTMINVVALSLLFAVVDWLRRRLTVDRPVKQITEAAQKMMQGDFSVRIPPLRSRDPEDKFGEIIECLNRMAEELSGTEMLRSDFVANVSHELKTPLAVMQNYGTMLQDPNLGERQRIEYAKAITDASRRLADLISNILKLNKLENSQIFTAGETYDLGEQLCECLLGFEDIWEAKHIEIATDIADGVLVCSDREMLSLVWNNLFSNAIKFNRDGGRLSLALAVDGEHAVVRISDTGCGISKEVGAHIFDKFYQGDTSRATQGNGLGLALVKRVIDITGSDIAVESEVGVGTTFTVKLRRVTDGNAQKNSD